MVGLLNSSCEICNTRKKGSQNAEYHNLMESMATGCTEDETCIEITADRGYREEGKRKVRKLSSLKRTKMDERKLKVS